MHRHELLLKNAPEVRFEHVESIGIIVLGRYSDNLDEKFNRYDLFDCYFLLRLHLKHLCSDWD